MPWVYATKWQYDFPINLYSQRSKNIRKNHEMMDISFIESSSPVAVQEKAWANNAQKERNPLPKEVKQDRFPQTLATKASQRELVLSPSIHPPWRHWHHSVPLQIWLYCLFVKERLATAVPMAATRRSCTSTYLTWWFIRNSCLDFHYQNILIFWSPVCIYISGLTVAE